MLDGAVAVRPVDQTSRSPAAHADHPATFTADRGQAARDRPPDRRAAGLARVLRAPTWSARRWASESLQQGLLAGLVGLGIVAVYMAVYYRGLGVLTWFVARALRRASSSACSAVLSEIGAFALSLPGIAGIVLTIGIAADTSILIFERFKEEVEAGKTYRTAARSRARGTRSLTSIDADVVTFVSALVLFVVRHRPGPRASRCTLIIGIVVDLTVAHPVHADRCSSCWRSR